MQGRVKCYDSNRGFGFIETVYGDYFVHVTNILSKDNRLSGGDLVTFNPFESKKGLSATNVRKISEVPHD